jgi:ATP-dependent Zn protease
LEHRISNTTRNQLDSACDNIIKSAADEARAIIKDNIVELRKIIDLLMHNRELNRSDLMKIITDEDSLGKGESDDVLFISRNMDK